LLENSFDLVIALDLLAKKAQIQFISKIFEWNRMKFHSVSDLSSLTENFLIEFRHLEFAILAQPLAITDFSEMKTRFLAQSGD